ncbi:glycosyltransferase family 2 protein, partial [Aeromicrobium sp.]|nr:glycosyltransferase family 2 protein [Candidatus Saccharibacteria bacterium]
AGTDLPDAVSGFRAYSKESLIQINTITRFSYTVETIIQAGNKRLSIGSIPITTNAKTRESRLFKSYYQLVFKQTVTIVRAYIMYKPAIVFGSTGIGLLVLGLVPLVRYGYFALVDNNSAGHLQSLIVGSTVLMAAFFCFALSVIADLVRINRILTEDTLEHIKRQRFN